MSVTQRREGETELDHLRRKELAWGLWQGDALERMSQQDQTIGALQARLRELETTLLTAKTHAQALAHAVIDGMAELKPDDLSRDLCGHINLMGGMGDPDYCKGAFSCRHVDLRARKPRAGKAVSP
jgi:hypothetical protein